MRILSKHDPHTSTSPVGRMQRQAATDRLLLWGAFGLTVTGLIATSFAYVTGSTLLSGAAVMATGFSSLVPDFLAYRRSKDDLIESRKEPTAIHPKSSWNLGIGHDRGGELPPDRLSISIEHNSHTLH